MREFIDHCQNRTSYKWNAIRYDLQLIDEISEPERHKSLETHLQRLMDGGPYRNNPIREFIRHFKDTIQPSTIDFLKNAASNPSADRKTRAQCYQSLVDLKIEGYSRVEFLKISRENAAFFAACEATIREVFTQVSENHPAWPPLKGAGHVSRCQLMPFVRTCIEGLNIPTETVRQGYSYARFYPYDFVKEAAEILGVNARKLTR
jgi:hypothetical protein